MTGNALNFGPAKRTPPAPPVTEAARLRAENRRLRHQHAADLERLLERLRRYEPDAT